MLSFFVCPHAHSLIGLEPNIAILNLARDIEAGSSIYVNDSHWFQRKFIWQEGFGAFFYSKSQIDRVIKYILNQEHHHKRTFKEVYLDLLMKFEIEFEEKYLFEFFSL